MVPRKKTAKQVEALPGIAPEEFTGPVDLDAYLLNILGVTADTIDPHDHEVISRLGPRLYAGGYRDGMQSLTENQE